MKTQIVFGLPLIILLFSGCSTPVQQVSPDVRPIVLNESQTRNLSPSGTISVPAGIYEPDFASNLGIYYRTPKHLIGKALGITFVQRGGIFIPYPPTEAQKMEIEAKKIKPKSPKEYGYSSSTTKSDFQMGVWYDQQEASGGLLGYAASSPKRIFRVDKPFVYEVQP